jgi:hypothetical protein
VSGRRRGCVAGPGHERSWSRCGDDYSSIAASIRPRTDLGRRYCDLVAPDAHSAPPGVRHQPGPAARNRRGQRLDRDGTGRRRCSIGDTVARGSTAGRNQHARHHARRTGAQFDPQDPIGAVRSPCEQFPPMLARFHAARRQSGAAAQHRSARRDSVTRPVHHCGQHGRRPMTRRARHATNSTTPASYRVRRLNLLWNDARVLRPSCLHPD